MHKCFFRTVHLDSRLLLKFECSCGNSRLVNKYRLYAELTSTWKFSKKKRSRWRNAYMKGLNVVYDVINYRGPGFAEAYFTGFNDGYHKQKSRYLDFEEYSFGEVYQNAYIEGGIKRKVDKELGFDEFSLGR